MTKEKQVFIELNRGFFDNFLWKESRTYSKAEAWLDLIQMASEEYNLLYMPNRFAKQWRWDKSKVFSFLKKLDEKGVVNISNGLINISNENIKTEGNLNHFEKDVFLNYSSVNFNRKTKIYILKLSNDNEEFIKIGIAFSVRKRISAYKSVGYLVEIIRIEEAKNRYVALSKEKILHEKYRKYQYLPEIKFGGFSECFSSKILLEI